MIASIRGEVLALGAGWVVIDVGGVGLRVEVPQRRLGAAHVGDQLVLQTQLVVREDSLTLYGFATVPELEVFGHLLGVSGVGPRSALGVLNELDPSQIVSAVTREDEAPFRKVSGIGPKTAKLIAVQLAGKLNALAFVTEGEATGNTAEAHSGARSAEALAATNVAQALVGLGYNESQAEFAVADATQAGAPVDEAGLLRAALALLQTPRVASGGTR